LEKVKHISSNPQSSSKEPISSPLMGEDKGERVNFSSIRWTGYRERTFFIWGFRSTISQIWGRTTCLQRAGWFCL